MKGNIMEIYYAYPVFCTGVILIILGLLCAVIFYAHRGKAESVPQQQSKMDRMFLSQMSHEIRTPLNAIIGYLEIAKDSGQDVEKMAHCIANSEIAAKHLLQIINDVLDISSIENGKMKIASEPFHLRELVTETARIFYQTAKKKGVRFEVNIYDMTEEWMVGDALRVKQVLMNLLSNAVKFTPEAGRVMLEITQIDENEQDVHLRFCVSDTGIGMSEEYMSHLFRPFEQESASTARKYGGSGLGLSITHNLVQMMGGSIDVKSKQMEGSKFTVLLHFAKTAEHKAEAYDTSVCSAMRALVIDCETEHGKHIKTMLKNYDVKADVVSGIEEAIKRIASRRGGDYAYELCLLDWDMPGMNGAETVREMRRQFDEELPVIIAFAYDILGVEEEAKRAGVNKVIAKPIFPSTLLEVLLSDFGERAVYSEIPEEKADRKTYRKTNKMERADMSGIKVLLAEDNEMNLDIAVTVLEKAGVTVEQTRDGQEAYDRFLSEPAGTFDMILMDIQMPVLNGYEASEKIRSSKHPDAENIPIIAMTASAFAEDVAEAHARGMNAHIAKPVNYDKLFELLQQFSK